MQHKLTSKQIQAIHFLVHGDSVFLISQNLKIRRETLWKWKRFPEFKEEYERVLAETKAEMQTSLEEVFQESLRAMKRELKRYESDPKRIETLLNVIKTLEK
ncbi:MAG: phBC6A51 family helix-turn-helix protein [Rickettsiales bacterium]